METQDQTDSLTLDDGFFQELEELVRKMKKTFPSPSGLNSARSPGKTNRKPKEGEKPKTEEDGVGSMSIEEVRARLKNKDKLSKEMIKKLQERLYDLGEFRFF